ncbi:MAG: phosphoribosylglycinamide formyltransferase [Candidatus Omnitrophica bacterium]|nr:phosphoribosylglycinamide formyltransferase [Candidatus Omnitrophota bacterium]
MVNLAVFCSGNGSNFQAILDAVRRNKLKATVAVMICDNPKAYALRRARRHGVPIVLIGRDAPWGVSTGDPRKAYEKILVRILRNQRVDLVVLAGFMRILTPYFIRAWRGRILNIHPSYLPAFKGAHAIRDAFEAGVKETGVTAHLVTEAVDAGPILMQEKVKVSQKDSLESLEKKIHRIEHQIYPKAIGQFIKNSLGGRNK